MAIKQSKIITKGPTPCPESNGDTIEVIASYTFDTAFTAASDILEIMPLPPYGKILAASVIGENIGATTLTVGLMSGSVGSTDPARTSGSELFNAVVGNVEAACPLATLAALATNGDSPRSLGIKVGADIAAGATKKVHLRLRYTSA